MINYNTAVTLGNDVLTTSLVIQSNFYFVFFQLDFPFSYRDKLNHFQDF